MNNRVETFKNFLSDDRIHNATAEVQEDKVAFKQIMNDRVSSGSVEEIKVAYRDSEAILINNITDSKGRLSDSLDAITSVTGFATLPLSITAIPDEITSLQRHKIYTLCGKKYAMSLQIRDSKIKSYCDAIIQNLQEGVPFITSLFKPFSYAGVKYSSLDLTEDEWTLILSKFRNYRSRLYVVDNQDLVMEVYPESVR